MNAGLQVKGVHPAATSSVSRNGLALQRKCSCGGSAGLSGECESCGKKKLAGKALQAKLRVNEPGDRYEQEADRVADQVMRISNTDVGSRGQSADRTLARKPELGISRYSRSEGGDGEAPQIVHDVLSAQGQPLDTGTRSFMESRFGHDFGAVRVHTDAKAAESARAVDASAYTVGSDVVFGAGEYQPDTSRGKSLMAHELTHVVQQTALSSPPMLSRYRGKSAFNFGRNDTAALVESRFTDPKKQPWVELITVNFDSSKTDTNNRVVPTGTAVAKYHANAAQLSDVTLSVTGGSDDLGFTDSGDKFIVSRIEGIGYNDVPIRGSDGEGPLKKYSKSLNSSMSYAVFFNKKQALHIGALNEGSHSCVHMGTDATAWDKMQQINYHSVVDRTKVHVTYDAAALQPICCARIAFLGVKKKGGAPNPCRSIDPKSCTTP